MKNKKGITLIALVITIIVLLILAGVSLSLTLGNNGILAKARVASEAHRDAEIEEELKIAYAAFKTSQEIDEIEEKNVYAAQTQYVGEKMEKRYGNKLEQVYRSGKNTKVEFENNNKVYVVKHDGTTYHYVKMKPTDIYCKHDENGTLYLRATPQIGYIKNGWGDRTTIEKIIIEEPIAPNSANSMFYNCINLETIENIENLHTENVESMYAMFNRCSKLKELDLSHFDTSNVTGMGYMFTGCKSLTMLNLNNFDTQNVESMQCMFMNCESLTNLNFSDFYTPNLTGMFEMFAGCKLLKNLDLSTFDTSNVTSMGYIFNGCNSLESINLSTFNTSNLNSSYDMIAMFNSCYKLTSLDLSSFDTSNAKNMGSMFSNCSKLKNLNLGRNFIISEGAISENGKIMSYTPGNIKVKTTQSIAIEIKKYSNLTDNNFEIIE